MFTIQAILYVAHGSRLQAAIEETRAFIHNNIERIDVPIQTICFIELAEPSIAKGIEQCIEQGATKIAVIPILLLAAGHAKKDIPKEIAIAKEKYPHITFTYGRPFGVHDAIIDTLVDRINEQKVSITKESRILIVGRGSTDESIIKDFAEIKERLNYRLHVAKINVCYLTARKPNLIEGLNNEVASGARKIFVVPYLLFTGFLMQSLEKQVKEINSVGQTFIFCKQINGSEKVAELFFERTVEAVRTHG